MNDPNMSSVDVLPAVPFFNAAQIFTSNFQKITTDDDPDAMLPSGGVTYPDINDHNTDFQSYYTAITALLNGTSPDTFSPTLGTIN